MTPANGPDHQPIANDTGEENEVLRETRRLNELKLAADKKDREKSDAKSRVNWKTAAGIGIGSAAVLAAVIYASRKKD